MQHKRVRANYVWNQLIAHAKRRFDGRGQIRVETLRNWDGVLIEESVFVRLKKGTDTLLSRNYPTQAALAFHDPVRDLFGGIARLELLYILNDAETDVDRIVLIQRHKNTVAWDIDLTPVEEVAQNVMPFAPVDEQIDTTSAADKVIKPKKVRESHEQREPGKRSI